MGIKWDRIYIRPLKIHNRRHTGLQASATKHSIGFVRPVLLPCLGFPVTNRKQAVCPFTKMVLKAKREALALPKLKAKQRHWRLRKSCRKMFTAHPLQKGSPHHYIPMAQDVVSKSSPNNLKRTPPGETSLTTMPSSSLNTKSATEKTEDNTTPAFIMNVKSNKRQITQAEEKL